MSPSNALLLGRVCGLDSAHPLLEAEVAYAGAFNERSSSEIIMTSKRLVKSLKQKQHF